jgi:multiple sugar transport system substrate-binding protein
MIAKRGLLVGICLLVLLAACGPSPTPQTIRETVEVTKVVVQTVQVTVPVEQTVQVPVKETVVVPGPSTIISVADNPWINVSLVEGIPSPAELYEKTTAELYPGIQLQMLIMANEVDKWHDQYIIWFTNNDGTADILATNGYWTPEFCKNDWLMPLDDIIDPKLIAEYDQTYLDVWRCDGKLYALGPRWAGIGGLYYRKDLLEKYNIEPPETYDDLLTACDQILPDNPDLTCWTWPAARNPQLSHRFAEVLYGFGGTYLDQQGRCAMNSPQGLAALEFMVGSLDKGYSPQEILAWDEVNAQKRFASGTALFNTGREDLIFWLDDPTKSGIVGLWDFISNPAQPGGRHSGLFDAWGYGINRFTDNPKEAAQALEIIASFEGQKIWAVSQGPIQGYLAVYDDPEVLKANPKLPMVKAITGTALPPFPSPNYAEVADLLSTEIHSALVHEKTAKAALDDACKRIDEIAGFTQ